MLRIAEAIPNSCSCRDLKTVIASEAKQSMAARKAGLLRRCAPRNDEAKRFRCDRHPLEGRPMATMTLTTPDDAVPGAPLSARLATVQIWGIAMLVPYLLVFAAFVVYPVGYGMWLARHPASYVALYYDPIFARTLLTTLVYMAIGVHIWKSLPFWTLILMTGRLAISADLFEAADVDGATWWQKFRFITWPSVRTLYLTCTLLSMIWTLGDFNSVYLLTGGGPADLTHVLATLGIRYLRLDQVDLSMATIVCALPLVLPLVYFMMKRLSR